MGRHRMEGPARRVLRVWPDPSCRLPHPGRWRASIQSHTGAAMKYLAPILVVFAILTDPQGHAIYIARKAVVAITATVTGCEHDARAKVYTSTVQFCVAEDPADVRNKVEGNNERQSQ